MLATLWNYRAFIWSSVKREFAARYLNSVLGMTWAVAQPAAMVLVYTLVFSSVMQAKLAGSDGAFDYGIYICSGILVWSLFAEILSRNVNLFVDHANLIKKVSFPRLTLPVIVILSALANFSMLLITFCLFLVVSGSFPGWVLLLLLPAVLGACIFGTGLGLTLGVLNVYFRDIQQALPIALQFWFWFTPVVYVADILPAHILSLAQFNPLGGVVEVSQSVFLGSSTPDLTVLFPATVIGALFCLLGLYLYRRCADEMVDEL